MLSWKRTISIGLIMIMLTSGLFIFTGAEADPTRNNVPILASGTVNPSTGYTDTLFNFTVWYTDYDGDAPTSPGLYINSVMHNMTEISSPNSSYARGVQFFYTTYLNAGNYSWYFYFVNGIPESARLPASQDNTLIVNSRSSGPQLSNGHYYPVRPDDSASVNFSVEYSHLNGTAPSFVFLELHNVHSGMNMTYNMTSSGTNYTAGVVYRISRSLSAGYYYYRFITKTTTSQHVYLPLSGLYTLYVFPATPPNNAPNMTAPGHSPQNPSVGQNINFWVTYSDLDGDSPSQVTLYYYPAGNNQNQHLYNTSIPQGNYTIGVNCSVSITAPLYNGTYHYFFGAWDNRGGHSTSSTNYFVVGNTTPPPPRYPYLSNGGASPDPATTNDTIRLSVRYVDPKGMLTPHLVRLGIAGTEEVLRIYNLTAGMGNISTGLQYYVDLSLEADNYTYSFAAYIGNYTTTFPLYGGTLRLVVTNGSTPPPQPPRDHSPLFGTASHFPVAPYAGDNITFTISYSDRDGDAPSYIRLHINSIISSRPYSVYNMTWTTGNYTYGITARYVLTLAAGNYSYYFSAASKNFTITSPSGGAINNLTVAQRNTPPPQQQDRAPTLTNPRMSITSPVVNQTIWFYVTYTDADNDPPIYVKLHLLGGSGANYLNFSMTAPMGTFSNGVSYMYSLSLLAGTYYYYYTAASTNFTVTNPASGTLSFTVSANSQPPPQQNRSNIAARIFYNSDDATIDVNDQGDDITVSLGDTGEDFFEIDVSSKNGEDRVIVIDLDPDMFDVTSPDDIVVKVDGVEIEYEYVADPAKWNGEKPAYYLEYTENGAILYVLLPEATTHTITAMVPQGAEKDNDIWYYVMAVILVLIIAAAIAISMLTMAQKKRIREYYEDFDTGIRETSISSGKLLDENDIDWDDLIEE